MILRVALLFIVVLPFTLVFLPIQLIILAARLPGWWILPQLFFKLLAATLGLKVSRMGDVARGGPVLLVSNHIGWLDIIAIASQIPVSFVARADLASWPIVGPLSRLQKTVFVDRIRRTATGQVSRTIAARLAQGKPVVLFAEGTSDIGIHVLPFRSALFGAVTSPEMDGRYPTVQPLAIAYTRISGLPISRAERVQVAWIGDMAMSDNLGAILSSGPKEVVLAFGDSLPATADRKAMARKAHAQVRQMLVTLNRSLPLPTPRDMV